jgi:hypothetical protein
MVGGMKMTDDNLRQIKETHTNMLTVALAAELIEYRALGSAEDIRKEREGRGVHDFSKEIEAMGSKAESICPECGASFDGSRGPFFYSSMGGPLCMKCATGESEDGNG